jgi:hypothetical protein
MASVVGVVGVGGGGAKGSEIASWRPLPPICLLHLLHNVTSTRTNEVARGLVLSVIVETRHSHCISLSKALIVIVPKQFIGFSRLTGLRGFRRRYVPMCRV